MCYPYYFPIKQINIYSFVSKISVTPNLPQEKSKSSTSTPYRGRTPHANRVCVGGQVWLTVLDASNEQ